MTLEGVVVDSNKGIFKVQVSEHHIVICTIAGKLKMNEIKIMSGDFVNLEVAPIDPSRGRITKRLKRAGQ